MATESKDVELRVRARDYSRKTLDDVTKALNQLGDAQAAQLAGAKKGEVSAKALADSYAKIENAVKALISQDALTRNFEAQAKALEIAKKAADDARQAQTDYANSLVGVEGKVKGQAKAQNDLARAVTNTANKQVNAQNALDRTVAKLTEFGIAANDIAGAQRRMADGVAFGNAALEKQDAALASLDADLAKAARASEDFAKRKAAADKAEIAALDQLVAASNAAAAAQARNLATSKAILQQNQERIRAEQALAASIRLSTAAAQAAASLEASRKGNASNATIQEKLRAEQALAAAIRQSTAAAQAAASLDASRSGNASNASIQERLRAEQALAAAIKQTMAASQAAASVEASRKGNVANAAIQEKLRAEQSLAAAMRASAQQAEASERQYASLARVVKSVRGDELANQLRLIIDPAGEANKNLASLETGIGRLAAKVSTINGPVKDFRATLQALEATQKGVSGIGSQIDAYKRQIDVLRAARTEYASARASVLSLTAAMKSGNGDVAELGNKLNAAQGALRAAATNMSATVTATRGLRDAVRAAGIDTSNLASEETRLTNAAKSATGAVNSLTAAFNKHGSEAEGAGRKLNIFGDATRQTLSYGQRLRGELLALATGFVGIQAAIGTATGALDAYKTAQKISGALGAAFGNDTKTIRAEWDYLMEAANRIGISFQEAAPAYAKFAIATKAFGLNGQETRFIFENLAKASRVAGLSADDFAGVLKAVEQSFSKGTIQAEELRGQLGDRLPGAFIMMAKSMGISTAELGKLMEAGAVTADAFLGFARTIGESFKPVANGLVNLEGEQARFNNALFVFKNTIAESGFADAYINLLKTLTTFFASADGQQFARDLSTAFSGVADVLRFVVQHIDEVQFAIKALIAITVGKWAYGAAIAVGELVTIMRGLYKATMALVAAEGLGAAIAGIGAVGTASTAAAGGVTVLRGALTLLMRSIPQLFALGVAISAAAWAYDKLTAAKAGAEGGKRMGDPKEGSWGPRDMKEGSWSGGPTEDPNSGPTASTRAQAKFDAEAKKRQEKLDAETLAAKKKSAKDQLAERKNLIIGEFDLIRATAKSEIKDKEELHLRLRDLDKQQAQALQNDQLKYQTEHAKSGAAAGKKEVDLHEQVKNELLRIQDEIARDETKADKNSSFDERKKTRLDAIAHSYDKLKKTISALAAVDQGGARNASDKLEGYIKQRQAVEAVKVTTEEVTRLEKELADQQALVNSKLEEQKALYDGGLISQEQFLANTAEINTRADTAVAVAAKNLQGFVDAAVAANAGILSLTQQADIKVKTTKASVPTADRKNDLAANTAQEQAIARLIAKREEADTIYKAQLDLRMITEDEFAVKVNANADAYRGKILELNDAFLLQLESQKALGILNQTLSVEQLAALDAQIAKQQQLGIQTAFTQGQLGQTGKTITQAFGSGLDTALNGVAQGLTDMATGAKSVGDGFKSMAVNALAAFGQLLQQIAMAIAKQLILNALAQQGGGIGGIAAQLGGVFHEGGIVGRAGGTKRAVNPSWFAGAPRFHEGGFPGLASDEVPAILQKGEQVLSRDDPANILNKTGTGNSDSGAGTRFVLVDDRKKVPEAMAGADGARVVVQHIRDNAATLKQLLK